MSETNKKWYVLRAVSGKEAKVKEYIEAELKHNALLSQYVSQVLIPMEKHAVLRNGKRVVKEKISLPGYVLVEAELKGDVESWDGTYNGRPLPSTDYWYTINIPEIDRVFSGHFTLIRSK